MAQQSAVRNWEAQQRTNTVLAQSIKQLKDELSALKELTVWKGEMEEQVNSMMDEMDTLRNGVKQAQLKRQASMAGASQMWGKVSQRVMNIVRGGGDGEGKSAKVADVDGPFPATTPARSHLNTAGTIALLVSLVIQGALCVPIGVWAYQSGGDTNTRDVAMVLCVCGFVMACLGALALIRLNRWHTATFVAFQPWVVALGAIYLTLNVKDVIKVKDLCDGDSSSTCKDLLKNSSVKLSLGVAIVLVTTLNSIFLQIKRDNLVTAWREGTGGSLGPPAAAYAPGDLQRAPPCAGMVVSSRGDPPIATSSAGHPRHDLQAPHARPHDDGVGRCYSRCAPGPCAIPAAEDQLGRRDAHWRDIDVPLGQQDQDAVRPCVVQANHEDRAQAQRVQRQRGPGQQQPGAQARLRAHGGRHHGRAGVEGRRA